MNPANPSLGIPAFRAPVVPVVTVTDVQHAVPLAQALLAGGIDVIEVTLRHAAGLPAIEAVARQVPEMQVGAGTVTRAHEMAQVRNAGARFALSPGLTDALAQAAVDAALPFIPGVMTPGEVMRAREMGFGLVKLFPATQAGGLEMLRALAGPLPDMKFCPTGGITIDSLAEYLRMPNVPMVGGSWLTPPALVAQGRWSDITDRARHACECASGSGKVKG